MAPLPAAKFIPEFGAAPVPPDMEFSVRRVLPEDTGVAHTSARATTASEEAYARGYHTGRAEALAEMEAKLEELRDYHAQQLSLERYTWANRESEKLSGQIGDGLKYIETRLAAIVARVLRPFLDESLHGQAVAELVSALEALLGADEGVTLEIAGPEDLLQLIRERLQKRNVAALFTPNEETDVRVVAGQTVMETCLGAWMRNVEERLE